MDYQTNDQFSNRKDWDIEDLDQAALTIPDEKKLRLQLESMEFTYTR